MERAATALRNVGLVVGSTHIVAVGAGAASSDILPSPENPRGPWKVYALARSSLPPWSACAAAAYSNTNHVVYLHLNLADPADVVEALPLLTDITHVSYAASSPTSPTSPALPGSHATDEAREANFDMLRNVLTAVVPNALVHVFFQKHFVEPFEPQTAISSIVVAMRPYSEDLPRLEYPDLEDVLLNDSRSDGAAITWSVHGSTTFFGFSPRSARNVVASLCVFAAICCKEGDALGWPGCHVAWQGSSDDSDAEPVADHALKLLRMLANHFEAEWSGYDGEDKCFIKLEEAMAGKEAHREASCDMLHNVLSAALHNCPEVVHGCLQTARRCTNGDVYKCENLPPMLATHFEMEWSGYDGEDKSFKLEGAMTGKDAMWAEMINEKLVETEPWWFLNKEELDTRKKCKEHGVIIWNTYFGSDSTSKVSYDGHGDSVLSLLFEKQNSGGFELNSLWCLVSYLKGYNTHSTGGTAGSSKVSVIKSFARIAPNSGGFELNSLWCPVSYLKGYNTHSTGGTAGSSKVSAIKSSARIAPNSAASVKRSTIRSTSKNGVGEDGEEDGPGDGKGGQPKTTTAGICLRPVTVTCVEDLLHLDPNTVRLSISQSATQEAAAEILREGNRRGFQFDKKASYYKAVWSCILENTESEEKEALDPDYHPFEESGEIGSVEEEGEPESTDVEDSWGRGVEEEGEPENTDVESSHVEDMDSWIIVEESDCVDSEGETEADGVETDEASSSPTDVPVPLEIVPPQPSGSATSPVCSSQPGTASQTNDFFPAGHEGEAPSLSVGGSTDAEDLQDEHDDTAESHSPPASPPSAPPSPASSVGQVALALWMPPENGEAPSSSHVDQPTSAEDEHDTAETESYQGNNSPPPPPPPSAPPCPASSAGPAALGIWMPAGRPEYAARLAFATVSPAERAVNPSPFIRDALYASLPHLHYNLLPSSRGTMLLRFDGTVQRDEAVVCSPFDHDGGRVVLERAEETSNRYRRPFPWLAAISATDFPPEHWFDENIRAAFRGLGTVIEIDQDCLDGFDHSSVRVVVEVQQQFVPPEMPVTSPDGGGSIVQLRTLRVWERHLRFDAAGHYIPFFTRTRTE